MDGKRMSANDLISIHRGREAIIARLREQLGTAYLVMPTTAITTPRIEPLEGDDELFNKVNLSALRNTMLGNVLGLCALALPNGHDAKGLPTSFLLSAMGGDDDRLLGDGLTVEQVINEASA
ncbi:MAG: amidase family protein, partial [Nitratireductor sp.]|jgi:aspartyl-tRNA(Asn)/glutamyl-tRNA(Gln) amidotransferase subunit A|nr:amidase family protein [Nitratireductor sp.]